MTAFKNWLRQLFCRHDYSLVSEQWVPDREYSHYRCIMKCDKCGKIKTTVYFPGYPL